VAFSAAAGGVVCSGCRAQTRDARPLSPAVRLALQQLQDDVTAWRIERPSGLRMTLRQLLSQYISYRLGKRPKLLPYLSG
jgi:hypothetical protein